MQIFAGKEFTNPIKIIEAFDNESFIKAFSQIEILRKRLDTYLLGYIRYEAKEIFLGRKIKSKYPLLYFEAYRRMEVWKDRCIENKPYLYTSIHPYLTYETYAKTIKRIKEEIAEGNTYQLNYTYDWEIQTELDGFELYKSILPRQTTPYNAYMKNEYEEILSFSPELFFELNENKIKTKPMKGTIKRGETEEEDEKNIEFLKNDVKNRAENVMIVDLLRNDLGKIAKTGTVKVEKLFEVETHNTVHQMTSEISAEIEENTTLYDIFDALFPCGSVTGAPKINTMEIIDKLETGKREVYCGAIGLISPEKTVFSVPIRILQKHNDEKTFLCRVGGAIVWDSTPEEEWEETLTKIKFLERNVKVGWASADFGKSERSETRPSEENQTFPSRRESKTAHQQQELKLVETMLVQDGKIMYEKEHFKRIKKSAKALGFKFEEIGNRKWEIEKECILRILLNKEGVFKTQTLPLDEIKTNIVTISKKPVNSKEMLLYYKTTYRPWYEKSMEKIKKGLIFDEIFFNEKGELTEGARSNIVLQIEGELFTPPVECGLLNGILRQQLLKSPIHNLLSSRTRPLFLFPSESEDYKGEYRLRCIGIYPTNTTGKMLKADCERRLEGKTTLLPEMPFNANNQAQVQHDTWGELTEKKLYLSDLKKAEKVFCINSVRGIVEVKLDFSIPVSLEGEGDFDTRREAVIKKFPLPVILNLFQ